MQEAHTSTENSGKFIDTLIEQWMKRTGNNIALNQTEQQMAKSSIIQESKEQIMQDQQRKIQTLQRKLKESQEAETSLSASLEVEIRNKEEIQIKLNATWESIETITEYFNYISESLANFQHHRANLSALYDNVIMKQQESIQKLQLSNTKSKDLEAHMAHLENKLLLREEKLQEALIEKNKLQKQLENSEQKLQLQTNELVNTHTEEKLMLVKEQQRLLSEYENLQSRLQMTEKEKYDIGKMVMQLENKLLLEEEKRQEILKEQNNLQKELEDSRREFYSQKNDLICAHAEEKKKCIEEQQQLLTNCENLQMQLKIFEQDNNGIVKEVAQKNALLSKLQDENSTYKNKIESMKASTNETYNKYEALIKEQDVWEKKLYTKTEKITDMEATLSAIKQKETDLINYMDNLEKKLTNEQNFSKRLENKLSDAQKDLKLLQKHNDESQKNLEKVKVNEIANIELQQQLHDLRKEKEEMVKQETIRIKDTKILYENTQMKHIEEILALRNNHETQLLELQKTIDQFSETTNNIRKDNSLLNMTLAEMREENSNLRNNYQLIMEWNDNLREKLGKATEMLHSGSITDEKSKSKNAKTQKQSNIKRKYAVRFNPDVIEISEARQCNVSTSANLSEKEQYKPLSQPLDQLSLTEEHNQKEQEAEVTSVGKKFFKSRPTQPRTYSKRKQNL